MAAVSNRGDVSRAQCNEVALICPSDYPVTVPILWEAAPEYWPLNTLVHKPALVVAVCRDIAACQGPCQACCATRATKIPPQKTSRLR